MNNNDLIKKVETLEKEISELKRKQELLIKHTKMNDDSAETKTEVIKTQVVEKTKVQVETKRMPEKELLKIPPVARPLAATKPAEKKTIQEEKKVVKNEPFDFEKVLGVWLPRVFMFILLLGVLWGFKLGIDYGWITPAVRIALGALVSGGLLYGGISFVNKSRKAFGLTLLGGYISVGLLTTFSAYELYDFIGYYVAMTISVAIATSGVYLSSKFNSEVVILFSTLGGLLLPFIIRSEEVGTGLIFPYLTAIFALIYIAALKFGHKYSYYITFFAYHVAMFVPIGLLSAEELSKQEHLVLLSFIVQHLIVLGFFLLKKVSNKAFSEGLLYTSIVSFITVVSIIGYSYIDIIFGSLAVVYLAITYLYRKEKQTIFFVSSIITIVLTSAFIISFFNDDYKVVLLGLTITSFFGLIIGLKFNDLRNILVSALIFGFATITILLMAWPIDLISIDTLLIVVSAGVFLLLALKTISMKEDKKGTIWFFYIGYIYALISGLKLVGKTVDLTLDFVRDLGVHSLNVGTASVLLFGITLFILIYLALTNFKGKFFAKPIFNVTFVFYSFLGFVSLFVGVWHEDDISLIIWLIVYGALIASFIWIMKTIITGNETFSISEQYKNSAVIFTTWATIIATNAWVLHLLGQLNFDGDFKLALHTLFIFALGIIAIKVSETIHYPSVKKIGYVIIIIAIVKLLLIDLSSYSLIIRVVIFLVVGVLGLLYSKRINKKD